MAPRLTRQARDWVTDLSRYLILARHKLSLVLIKTIADGFGVAT